MVEKPSTSSTRPSGRKEQKKRGRRDLHGGDDGQDEVICSNSAHMRDEEKIRPRLVWLMLGVAPTVCSVAYHDEELRPALSGPY